MENGEKRCAEHDCSVAGQGADERVRAGSSEGTRGDSFSEIGSKPDTGNYKVAYIRITERNRWHSGKGRS